MLLGFVLLFLYGFIVWLVFFKFRWLKFTIAWGFFSTFFVLHLGIIFLIGLRYVAPASTDARVIQRTIQLTPRLSEPTLVTAVLVEPNVPVKRGTPLFQFDRRPYEFKVRKLEAQLAKAKQDVLVLKADTAINAQKIAKSTADLAYAKYQLKLSTQLASKGAGPEEDAQKWTAQVASNEAAIKEIVEAIGDEIPTQLGGGIRDLDTIERYIDGGLRRRTSTSVHVTARFFPARM